ncbi:hypothetical protein TNIN_377471 [Trichonephila inaurata madagascariensis]|uniref:Uncharacterized protein n=1 Tax=Trichonephila inaurata madagascariensis TaxID=2747483 RepID=A0A8X6YBK0_9ARAC|nr:hypothetical protein TNIN_377471 [Trichonephila inaurata madagascariensis]
MGIQIGAPCPGFWFSRSNVKWGVAGACATAGGGHRSKTRGRARGSPRNIKGEGTVAGQLIHSTVETQAASCLEISPGNRPSSLSHSVD